MSIQSTANQAFSLLALATSGSRARRKEVETLKKNISTSSITAEKLRKDIEIYDEASDNEEKTLEEWEKELKGRADLYERYDTAFQKEINAKRKLFEM
jgi:gas vesicle protein